MTWIPVTESLPELGVDVLCSTEGDICIAEMEHAPPAARAFEVFVLDGRQVWFYVDEFGPIKPDAWQPLPEPYVLENPEP